MDKCKPESLLTAKNIKSTKQRIAILDLIISIETSFCANDLYDKVKREMDLVTIYRNLQILFEAGILREVMNKSDRQYFEIACEHNPVHPHFYCSKCKKIFCMKSGNNSNALNKVKLDKDFLINETVLNYSGICPKCRH